MNENHELCAGPEWAAHLTQEVLPVVTANRDLGADLIEVGPVPGAGTDWLRRRVERLVAVEIEAEAAARLRARFAATNIEVLNHDATWLPFSDNSFDSAASLTMLHHLPTVALQNRLLGELLRVLRPGGVLVGCNSRASVELHHFHAGDVYNPVEPASVFLRLETLGYERVTVSTEVRITFAANKPDSPDALRGRDEQ